MIPNQVSIAGLRQRIKHDHDREGLKQKGHNWCEFHHRATLLFAAYGLLDYRAVPVSRLCDMETNQAADLKLQIPCVQCAPAPTVAIPEHKTDLSPIYSYPAPTSCKTPRRFSAQMYLLLECTFITKECMGRFETPQRMDKRQLMPLDSQEA